MYDEVVSDNKKNVKVIKELRAKVTMYEKERNLNLKPPASVETQKEHDYTEIPCNACIYEASCEVFSPF